MSENIHFSHFCIEYGKVSIFKFSKTDRTEYLTNLGSIGEKIMFLLAFLIEFKSLQGNFQKPLAGKLILRV